MDRRDEVIQYVQEKYGRDKVGQIITFGALLSKAAVRDIGRVLQMPYGQVDRLSKMIPVEGV
jgi:DNA polymerase-3 subunit alpha